VTRSFPIDDPRFEPSIDVTSFAGTFDGDHLSAWGADRVRFGDRVAMEAGLRWDRQSLTSEEQWSPRLNLVVDLSGSGALRAGWGHFFQSQRPQELEVQFGETEHQLAQRAEHWSLGWERALAGAGTLRIEAYRQDVSDPQRRYETLFDPAQPFPQIALDLIQVEAEEAWSEGVELYLRGRTTRRRDWWLSYVWSRSREVVDGAARPRWHDQPHTFIAAWIERLGPKWSIASTFRYHTGWPTTAIAATLFLDEADQRHITYDVGELYAERWPAYHSLDLRLSRATDVGRGRLVLFLDVQNLYDHENVRGLQLTDRFITSRDGRTGDVQFGRLTWFELLPSFGVSWEF
jgi:outer membrane receptor protein involved in Fe transport